MTRRLGSATSSMRARFGVPGPASPSAKSARSVRPSRELAHSYRVLQSEGGVTFNLNLNVDAQICVSGSQDPSGIMSRRIQKAFKLLGVGAPNFAFSLEVTRDDGEELHVHGCILLGDLPRDIAPS